MDKLSTATIYNLLQTDEVLKFIPTGFTNGDVRLFYVIKESPYNQLEPGSVVSADVLSDKEVESAFGVKLPTRSGVITISRTIKATPNDKDLGTTLRDRQIELEQSNPTFEFDKYKK